VRRITPCMWFDHEAEEAARHYVSVFPLARINAVMRLGNDGRLAPGTASTVNFELDGEPFLALNVGAARRDLPPLSLVVHCDTQEEVDHYWLRLSDRGRTHRRGWLHDRFGVSWQVVPSILGPMLGDRDRAAQVFEAWGQMQRPDIAHLQQVFDEAQPRQSEAWSCFAGGRSGALVA
jgi:predicted 3-demethylubiquinone-9 3-methyltransferase (glyoxalase superfamily)